MATNLDSERLRALIEAGRVIVSDLDVDSILGRVLETARQLTGARYAALGVLDAERHELERFITRGIDDATVRSIGALPLGRGVLGVLIDNPQPLRLASVGEHPASYGFPAGHPPMETFLGVPIVIRGRSYGNLYLTEKDGGEFDEADEDTAIVLARWAGIAIENARLYQAATGRSGELERALRGLEATRSIALAVGGETDLDRILELIVKRGRALADARSVVIFLREGNELLVAASAGHASAPTEMRIPIEGSTSGEAMSHGIAMRISDVRSRMRIPPEQFGISDASTALLVPLMHRGVALGVLAAFDRGGEGGTFSAEDEQALGAFAASAATAVATAQSVQQDRLRSAIEAADVERRRWAQELHDETLQALGGLRVLLSSARRTPDKATADEVIDEAIEGIEREITNLRSIINELRPAALDQLGLIPALEALLDRHRTVNDLEITVRLPDAERATAAAPTGSLLATTIYRVVQEALTNVVKHSGARQVSVDLEIAPRTLTLEVADDGRGFAVDSATSGFGLTGMRERVVMTGGDLSVVSDQSGTRILATMPLGQEAASADSGGGIRRPRLTA